jgi:hypothetical protein
MRPWSQALQQAVAADGMVMHRARRSGSVTMTTTTNKEFVVPLENKPGTIAEVATALGGAHINIVAYLVEAQGEFGILRVVTNNPSQTETWLKSTNRAFRSNEVIVTPVKANVPGELGRIATTLAKSGVNITASYPTETGGLVFAVDNVASARKALGG